MGRSVSQMGLSMLETITCILKQGYLNVALEKSSLTQKKVVREGQRKKKNIKHIQSK